MRLRRHQPRPGNRRAPGLLAIGGMAFVTILAGGFAGTEAPAQQYIDDALAAQLAADTRLEPIGDPTHEADPRAGLTRDLNHRNVEPGADRPREYVRDFRQVARRIAVEEGIRVPALFVRQIAAESGMQPCVRSHAGAIGIAQIMPDTARSWKVDPYLPEAALRAAARNMARYHRQLGSWKLALAAYNAGPGAVAVHGGVPPYEETREYIRRITDRSYPLPGMAQTFRLPAGYSSRFGPALKRLIKAVEARGGTLTVVSGFRTYEEQLRLWNEAKRKYGGWWNATQWVAPPGCSNHNRGWAADLSGSLELAHQLAPRFGLVFPMAHEPWHVELAGIDAPTG